MTIVAKYTLVNKNLYSTKIYRENFRNAYQCKQYAGIARTSDCKEPHNCIELQTTLQMCGNEITICLQRTFSPCFADISECTIA